MGAPSLVPVTVAEGTVVHSGAHAFQPGDTIHVPEAHAAELAKLGHTVPGAVPAEPAAPPPPA
jgi:hypothetical protein